MKLTEFIRYFGKDELADGRTVRDVLKVLPAEAAFQSVDDMFSEVSEREAMIVRTTVGAHSAVSAALGIEAELENVADADIAMLAGVPTKARAALAGAGISTLGKLADAHPEQVLAVMKRPGYARRRRRRRVDRLRPDAEQAALNGRCRNLVNGELTPLAGSVKRHRACAVHRRHLTVELPRGIGRREAQALLFTR